MAWTFLRQEIAELGTDIHLSHGLLGHHVGMLATTYTQFIKAAKKVKAFNLDAQYTHDTGGFLCTVHNFVVRKLVCMKVSLTSIPCQRQAV